MMEEGDIRKLTREEVIAYWRGYEACLELLEGNLKGFREGMELGVLVASMEHPKREE